MFICRYPPGSPSGKTFGHAARWRSLSAGLTQSPTEGNPPAALSHRPVGVYASLEGKVYLWFHFHGNWHEIVVLLTLPRLTHFRFAIKLEQMVGTSLAYVLKSPKMNLAALLDSLQHSLYCSLFLRICTLSILQ